MILERVKAMFGLRSDKRTDALIERVAASQAVNDASYNRLEQTIQRVIDEKNNKRGRKHGTHLHPSN